MKWQPGESVRKACKLGHPFGSKSLLPKEMCDMINGHFDNILIDGHSTIFSKDIMGGRIEWCCKWTKDPLDLQKEEQGLL